MRCDGGLEEAGAAIRVLLGVCGLIWMGVIVARHSHAGRVQARFRAAVSDAPPPIKREP